MLANGFCDFPGAGKIRGKNHEIASAEMNRFPAVRSNCGFAFQQVAGFFYVVGPGKFAHAFFPDIPVEYAKIVQFLPWRFFYNLYVSQSIYLVPLRDRDYRDFY